MTDKDLYPCPHCRGEMVSTCWNYDAIQADEHYVYCESCEMQSPVMPTADEARQVYNVVAKLVDDVMNAYSYPLDKEETINDLVKGADAFFKARREYPPY